VIAISTHTSAFIAAAAKLDLDPTVGHRTRGLRTRAKADVDVFEA